jgi:hypothetical protein
MDEFDVKKYELEDTSVLTVKNARGDDDLLVGGKPVTIEVYSPGSPQGVKALHKAGRATQLRLFRTMRGDIDPRDAENADREQAEKLTGFTKTINNFPVDANTLYSNPRLCYIARQVEEHIGKFGNFSKGPSPS